MISCRNSMLRMFAFAMTVAAVTLAQPGDANEAEDLFQRYVALERSFDAEIGNLYADAAIVRNTRRYPNGRNRTIEIPVSQLRKMLVAAMPLAKARGDMNQYSNVTYTREGNGFRIRASRFSELKRYSSRMSMLVAPDSSGEWKIFQEVNESSP
jgi:hypothetical protein